MPDSPKIIIAWTTSYEEQHPAVVELVCMTASFHAPSTFRARDRVLRAFSAGRTISSLTSLISTSAASAYTPPIIAMPGVIVAHPRIVEYRVDAKGNRIRQGDRYAVTPRYQAACCQFQSSLYDRGALDQLPPQYLVSRRTRHSKAPRFHFGLGVTTLQLYEYAFKHKLVPEENRVHPGLTVVTLWATVKELVRVSGAGLYLGAVIHPDYQWIVARFSNYTWRKERMVDADEQRVVDCLQAELRTLDTLRWYEESDSD